MRPMRVHLAERAMPGAAPVSDHSTFASVARAVKASAEVVEGREPTGDCPERRSLLGTWQRLVLPEDALLGELPASGSEGWHPVRVPDNYGLEPSLSAHFGPVFYRRRLPALSAPRVRLWLESVDYLCDVWVDDLHLGRHEGYFAPFAFDVTDVLRDGALLTVGVQDPFEDLDPELPLIRHAKRVIKGTLKYHDSRPGGLPGRHTPGWTARESQSMTTGGVTGGVRLVGTGLVRIEAVFVTPLDHESGRVHVALVLSNDGDPAEVDASLCARPKKGEPLVGGLRIRAPHGPSRVDFEIAIDDPELWWPRSCSEHEAGATYRLDVEARVHGDVSDVHTTTFGIRTAKVDGDPKRLVVNGRPVFVQAVNYIPRQHFADVDIEFYRRDMKLCAEAHLNSIGVHGHVQCRACYDAADEAGVLVFQDFALQWHYDSGTATNPGFVEKARQQIAEMAYTFYNHPSIVYWACHNEPTALFVPGMKPDAENDFDNQVLDEALEERLREVEPVRHVHRASGIGDDLHLYDGSLNGGDVYGVRNHETWFVSEFGFWTAGPESYRWGDLRWPPDTEQMREWLSRLSFGPWTFNFTGLPERYPSMSAWRHATELYGAFLAKYQTEWIRIRRGEPFHAYRWHFFCDWWGWAGGGLVDVDRRPKATYRAYADASRPILVCTSLPGTVFEPGAQLELPVHAINETPSSERLDVSWSWHRADESVVIGVDEEVPKKYELPNPATPRAMVAMPSGGPFAPAADVDRVARSGRLTGTVPAESARELGRVSVQLADESFAGGTLELRWGNGERNWFHVIAAPKDWFCGPGAYTVGPDGVRRLR